MPSAYKKKTRGFFKTALLIILLLPVAGFLAYKIYTVSLERYQINKQSSTVSAKLQELAAKNKDLKALVIKLQDKSFLEKEARKKLNYQLPGEQSIIITRQSSTGASAPLKETAQKASLLSNAKRWLEVLFGK